MSEVLGAVLGAWVGTSDDVVLVSDRYLDGSSVRPDQPPKLKELRPETWEAFVQAAAPLGASLDRPLTHATLVPRGMAHSCRRPLFLFLPPGIDANADQALVFMVIAGDPLCGEEQWLLLQRDPTGRWVVREKAYGISL